MLITFGLHLYEKCIPHLSGKFSKMCSNKKKVTMVSKHTLFQISLYPWDTYHFMGKKLSAIALPTLKS
jgi:hypothetical protein